MFVRIDKKTQEEETISSEEMVNILERDLNSDVVDEVLTEIVCGIYEHSDAGAIYKYKR
ncbi:N-carbamoyl-L-amino acid amidohydrolase [Mariprofundus erugo]|uniref:N-carbamoyl-L-amino acid amidohydrolase n=1 Tax=Mariprofundus erugo TaxID=2528639 RepID=A0A5R9GHL2_9PROT|nr:N-carbamoyl-L-amino acid amidohydrolase [Mariprofundus erugo]TLS66271.1 N-carbamoyl-L-amino acid amidohydrolase [Mariprofundus erugo]TLS78308.1 N-carbamoyl-L-amino acid amidohydrolase [Mariprofundus erugo]